MSGRVLSFEVVVLCTSLASAACAPGTDESPLSSPSTAAPRGAAGAPTAGGAARPAGAPALPTPGATGGMGSLPTTVGVAGRAPLAGMPAAAGSNARGPTAGVGAAGMGPIAMNPLAGGGAPLGAAGVSGSAGGAAPGTSTGGSCGSGTPTDGRPTTGPLACIVEQHNAVREKVMSMMPLAPVTWNADIAKYAQEWTDMTCMSPKHRSNPTLNGMRLGENLYASIGLGPTMAGKEAVDGWAGEVACYTYGKFMSGDKCDMNCTTQMHSDGCGHYTQVVWRASIQIGCGVTTCGTGRQMQTEVICNYAPAGNFVGMLPY